MDDPLSALEFETMLLLNRHATFMTSHTPDGRKRLDRSAYVILSRMRMAGPMSIGELSEAFGLDTSTLNRQTAALVRAGLAERIPDPDGGIARKFRLTAAGDEQLDEAHAIALAGFAKIFADWSDDDVRTLSALLKRFNTDIERLTGHPWPRP